MERLSVAVHAAYKTEHNADYGYTADFECRQQLVGNPLEPYNDRLRYRDVSAVGGIPYIPGAVYVKHYDRRDKGIGVKNMEKFHTGTNAGWRKGQSPVLGGNLGTCFDISVLRQDNVYKMYFSWRPQKSIALTESKDGLNWSEPRIVLGPRATAEGWEDDLNRPAVVYRDGIYHMWYTGQFKAGQADGTSHIFYSTSKDGVNFERVQDTPVLCPQEPWEKCALMCPHVMWDGAGYKMWYSGGEQYEPNAIGYATSPDGVSWTKYEGNPIFQASSDHTWERHKTAACHVIKTDAQYVMFYVGFQNEDYAQIGIAVSNDGIRDWRRHPQNPIIAPTPGNWDGEACYKPFVLYDGEKWVLWYNGRNGSFEQIGVAFHDGIDLI
jgi:predicted GH43/DUF377 family glycosyl hydrolase